MVLYVFHICRADGSSPTFEAFDLDSEEAVIRRANSLLQQHLSCDHVDAWRDDEFILRLDRKAQPAAPPPSCSVS